MEWFWHGGRVSCKFVYGNLWWLYLGAQFIQGGSTVHDAGTNNNDDLMYDFADQNPSVKSVDARTQLVWPGLCLPLFERRDDLTDYEWAKRCRGYSYADADQRHAHLCGLTQSWHHSTACELYRIAADCSDNCVTGNMATAETLRSGLRRGKAPLPRGAGEMVEVLLAGALPQVIDAVPAGELTFPMFVSMYTIAVLCLKEQPEGQQRIYHLRPKALDREGCKDLIVDHFDQLYESIVAPVAASYKMILAGERWPISAAMRTRACESFRRHVIGFLPQGPLGVADSEPQSTAHYSEFPQEEVWSRFVVRTPRDRSQGIGIWLRMQEAWGWQNAWAAVKLAGRLDSLFSDGGDSATRLDAWLDELGIERQSMYDGRERVDGEQRQMGFRRWRATHRTLTPISGAYRPMWRAALLRRVSAAPASGPHLFQAPKNSDNDRAWRCGAVISWADLNFSCAEAFGGFSGQPPAHDNVQHPSMIPLSSDKCRVILNRAALRSPTDAEALGYDDCGDWYGVPLVKQNSSYSIRPQWIHADIVGLDLLQSHFLPHTLDGFWSAAKMVHDVRADTDTMSVIDALSDAVERIAEFSFYMFSSALYTRGSAAISILAHHAMYMYLLDPPGLGRAEKARHRLQALRCVPNWSPHAMPDIEAATSHTVEEYTREVYWSSFDAPTDIVRDQLLTCLASELDVSEDSITRGVADATKMRQVLKDLEKSHWQVSEDSTTSGEQETLMDDGAD